MTFVPRWDKPAPPPAPKREPIRNRKVLRLVGVSDKNEIFVFPIINNDEAAARRAATAACIVQRLTWKRLAVQVAE